MSYTKTSVAGVPLESYVMNASGPLDSTYEELGDIAESDSTAIVMKSCTISSRDGNPEPRYATTPFGSLQSMGLPNLGYKAYVDIAQRLLSYNKPIIASIAGFSLNDYQIMVEAFQDSNVSLIELNLSCPNIEGKSILAYDFEGTNRTLEAISGIGSIPIGLKLPPYLDISQHQRIADLILSYDIGFITCINSVGNALVIDPISESPLLRPKGGLGGLSGSYIKPIALANVRIFYELLEDKVSIFGVGGIKNGFDAFEFLLAGADAVQVGTSFEKEGHGIFNRINNELENILRRKNYNSIEAVKGKLKQH